VTINPDRPDQIEMSDHRWGRNAELASAQRVSTSARSKLIAVPVEAAFFWPVTRIRG